MEKRDYRMRQAASLVEVSTGVPYTATSASKRINIPVLTVNGTKDGLFCFPGAVNDCSSDKALAKSQKPLLGPHATVRGKVVPGAGHSLNMQRNAPEAYASMLSFLDRYAGT